ncbi:glutathione S-transferase [Pseudovirgaria hyperparasitica]|uniref:Glutathione S-transferase n=1 Tax=Pseudovirgaria hyperparasitica TaxID=470096 RepID=A0A6A6WDY6_9PEZI|nr:glutathione S-transferase [Pseudovirgaria hyperparasitica]KAF2759777.1 glutathione S-transferase [Pseudovirgaria hyperparasitica]
MAPLILYVSPGACSLFNHILLRESKLDFSLVVLDITKTNGFPETHAHLNPKKRVPILILEDGKTTITETVAIASYIDRRAPEAGLFGKSDLEAVRCYEWFNWLSGTVHERGFGALFLPKMWTADEAAWDGVRVTAREWVQSCFAQIEERLQASSSGYSVGDEFTAADVFLYVEYRWGNLLGMDMEALYPALTKLVGRVVERESVREAARIEGIPLILDDRGGDKERNYGKVDDSQKTEEAS